MKVVLKQEVDNLGLAGDVVDVADGYGRNYLLPRGMAILATKGSMKQAEAMTRARKVEEAKTIDDAYARKAEIEEMTLKIEARVDERGRLYGSVGTADIARVLKDRGHRIEAKRIELRSNIKDIGPYEVEVQVHPQVMATANVEVLDEEGEVIYGQISAPEVAPLPGEAVELGEGGEVSDAAQDIDAPTSSIDSLVDQALEAAQEIEDEDTSDGDTDVAAIDDDESEDVIPDAAP